MQITINQEAGEAYIKCNLNEELAIVKQAIWKVDNYRINTEVAEASPDYGPVMEENWPEYLTEHKVTNSDIQSFVEQFKKNLND